MLLASLWGTHPLVDAAPKPILFNRKAMERLNKHYRLDMEMLSLIKSMWVSGGGGTGTPVRDKEDATLHDFSALIMQEQLAPTTLQRLNKIWGIVQEHLGYTPEEVSLRNVAIVRWAVVLVMQREARLSTCCCLWSGWRGRASEQVNDLPHCGHMGQYV